jgi:hypothetical protein
MPYCLATSSKSQVVNAGSYMSSPISSESSVDGDDGQPQAKKKKKGKRVMDMMMYLQ